MKISVALVWQTVEYKPFKFSRLVMDGSVMDYLLEFEYHLKGYAKYILEMLQTMIDDIIKKINEEKAQ